MLRTSARCAQRGRFPTLFAVNGTSSLMCSLRNWTVVEGEDRLGCGVESAMIIELRSSMGRLTGGCQQCFEPIRVLGTGGRLEGLRTRWKKRTGRQGRGVS